MDLMLASIVTVVGASIKVMLAILTAYALVFVRFPFKNAIFMLNLPKSVLMSAMMSGVAGQSSWSTLFGFSEHFPVLCLRQVPRR